MKKRASKRRFWRRTTCKSCGRELVSQRAEFLTRTGGAFCHDCEGSGEPQPVRDPVYPKDRRTPVLDAAYFKRLFKRLHRMTTN